MHKTGTSSIQNALFNKLKDERFHYADLKTPNHSSIINSIFSDNPYEYHAFVAKNHTKSEIDEIIERNKELLEKSITGQGQNITEIISGEDIGYFNENELIKLREYLIKYFENIKVVIYIRPFYSYVQSAFQELVKHGLNKIDFKYCNPRYERFILYEDIFKSENVIVRPYIRNMLYKEDVVYDFFHIIGIDIEENLGKTQDNVSLSVEALKLLFTYQKFANGFRKGKDVFNERNFLIKKLSKIGNKKLCFCRELTDKLLEENRGGIEYFEEKLNVNLVEHENKNNECICSEKDMYRLDNKIITDFFALMENESIDFSDVPIEYIVEKIDLIRNKRKCISKK
jgi:hypothetical protein